MLRVVFDPGVLISALLVADGPPGRAVDRWRQGEFELIVSPLLLDELEDVLRRPHLTARVGAHDGRSYVAGLRRAALSVDDPPSRPRATPDPDDDYLVALANAGAADLIVSGDAHLTALIDPSPPIMTPRAFVDMLEGRR